MTGEIRTGWGVFADFLSFGTEEADTPKPVRIGVRTASKTIRRKYSPWTSPKRLKTAWSIWK